MSAPYVTVGLIIVLQSVFLMQTRNQVQHSEIITVYCEK